MRSFTVGDDFYLDGQPFKILSGAIHYFRIHPSDWYHSLYNLKALGFNTVETYLPWNRHEPKEGVFDFSGQLDIEKFLDTAQSLGLYAIVRPSPFICAEWEFGGLPAWLLTKEMRIRSSDPRFLKAVEAYYDNLLPRLTNRLLEKGGNILMMQVENEYGSYGEDKDYLRALASLMRERGVTCPLFTSDGPWLATLKAGTLIDDDILVTGNFGSRADENFQSMQKFFKEHEKQWPLMCMEFWDGWFSRWGESRVLRDPEELAQAVSDVLKQASINLYMFHGGTNFSWFNGCSARGVIDLPQVTSYDYDALLNEQGNPTPKYFAVQDMLRQSYPMYEQAEPLVKTCLSPSCLELAAKVSLFEVLDDLAQPVLTTYPLAMEDLGQSYGYLLYRTQAEWDAQEERLRVIDARDRIQLFVDQKWVTTQYQTEIGEDIMVEATPRVSHQLDILVENMGRVNYGHKLLADTQKKGIRTGVCKDLHFMLDWQQYRLDFEDIDRLDFSRSWKEDQPAFYAFDITIEEPKDAYLDLSQFGKGVVFVNGHHIGRFWQKGPSLSLYVPHGLWVTGKNRIIIFETEGIASDYLPLIQEPLFKQMEGEML